MQDFEKFFNRDLSWLDFNKRVLYQVADPSIPLLERIKFLGIFYGNLDEFFMKRVGGLKRHLAVGVRAPGLDGIGPLDQLRLIREKVLPDIREAEEIYINDLLPALRNAGIELLSWDDLSREELTFATEYFHEKVFSLLTPLAVDAAHPFPLISNLSTSLGVALRHPDPTRDERLFARVKVSNVSPQWLLVSNNSDGSHYRFISTLELIRANLQELFPKMEVMAWMPFRITRNAELETDEEEVEDLLELIEEEVRLRRFARAVRLEHAPNPDPWIVDFILNELELQPEDVYELHGELDSTSLMSIAQLNIPKLRFQSWIPVCPVSLHDESSIFDIVRSRDILVHHPYESFALSVERFVREAAYDPGVQSIKMTVYRVGDESPLIPLLIQAAESGKHVVCLVELKARFEEERNIVWAQKLEDAGVHVVYGIPGLKTHAKTLLIVRQEPDGVKSYAHIGTGNYHSKTANLYTDVGLFTARAEITTEIVHFFNYLTGRSLKDDYKHLLVAPVTMAERLMEYCKIEMENAQKGLPARIIAKMNSLEDRLMIEQLYEASQAGVKVELIVRGLCCLRPGVQGLSENIRVVSILGRLLEHSRVFYFQGGKEDPLEGRFYIGSADWMARNLYRRVEVLAPVESRSDRERLWDILSISLIDTCQAWELQPDGEYVRVASDGDGADEIPVQELLMRLARDQSHIA